MGPHLVALQRRSMLSQSIKNDRTLLAKSPGLPRRATMGCDNPPLPKRSCSFVAVSAMNEQAIDFANSIPPFLRHSSAVSEMPIAICVLNRILAFRCPNYPLVRRYERLRERPFVVITLAEFEASRARMAATYL